MTFVQTRLLRVIEEVLPARFGGTSGDYQLLEEEHPDGILPLILNVSPTVGPMDETRLREIFLEELKQDGDFGEVGAKVWDLAGIVQVRRDPPVATRRERSFHSICSGADWNRKPRCREGVCTRSFSSRPV